MVDHHFDVDSKGRFLRVHCVECRLNEKHDQNQGDQEDADEQENVLPLLGTLSTAEIAAASIA